MKAINKIDYAIISLICLIFIMSIQAQS